MFNLGDKVQIAEEFEGCVTVAGWDNDNITDHIFEVISFEEFAQANPEISEKVKAGPTKKEVFLKGENIKPFVLSPYTALELLEAAPLVCKCPIDRLWQGLSHYTGCSKN